MKSRSLTMVGLAAFLWLGGGGLVRAERARVAVLVSRMIAPYEQALSGFREVLDADYRVFQLSEGEEEQLQRLKRWQPQLVLALGSSALNTAESKLSRTKIVALMVMRPQRVGARTCGVSLQVPAERILHVITRLRPNIVKIGIPYDPQQTAARVEEFREAAKKRNLQLVAMEIGSRTQLLSNLKLLIGAVDAVYMPMDKQVVSNFKLLQSLCLANRKPLVSFSYRWVEKGALLALYPIFTEQGRQAAGLAKKLLSGTSPADIGFVAPEQLEIAFHTGVAGKFGIAVPDWLRSLPHRFYE